MSISTPITIYVPRINDKSSDFNAIADIWQEALNVDNKNHIIFDFSRCDFLRPNAVVFLGGLARLIQESGRTVHFSVNTMQQPIKMNLLQNGFASVMGADTEPWLGNSIPYREYLEPNKDNIIEYLRDDWLGRGWINISANLKNEIAGRMWEIFANAFEHSLSGVGIVCCGQFFKTNKELVLAVADFGVGIPSNVKTFEAQVDMEPKDAMQWAFTRGNSTSKTNGPRGVGLDLLKDFVKVSKGTLAIYSHGGYAHIDESGELYDNHTAFFKGTIVQVTLRCDDNYYCLSSELDSAQYF